MAADKSEADSQQRNISHHREVNISAARTVIGKQPTPLRHNAESAHLADYLNGRLYAVPDYR